MARPVATLTAVPRARRRHPSLVATLLVLALALVAGGCGDSGDDSSGSDSSTPAGGSDQQQVKSVVEGLYEDLADYDAEAVCQRMSPSAQRQIAGGVVGKAKEGATCAEAFGEFLDQAKENGGLKRTLQAKVGKVDIDGKKALVTVSFGAQRGQIPLSRIDGEWKMGIVVATPSAEPPAKPGK